MKTILLLTLGFLLGCSQRSQVFASSNDGHDDQITIDARPDFGSYLANIKQTGFLRVGLTGFTPKSEGERAGLNVALVIDRSGSMAGQKLADAKRAAEAAVNALKDDDIVSIVTYDSHVNVLVPATKASDRYEIIAKIRQISAGGDTALYAGTVKGGAEVEKFKTPYRVNRVILLSDGQANVGPSSTSALADLGARLRRGGITVSTLGLGLGYNEDLMFALAKKGGGQHTFVESSRELADIFRRGFNALGQAVAKEAVLKLTFNERIRPVRVLGINGDIVGQHVTIPFAALYAHQTDDVLVEFEMQNIGVGNTKLADISLSYLNVATRSDVALKSIATASFTTSKQEHLNSEHRDVKIRVVEHQADMRSEKALALRDAGDVQGSQQLIQSNMIYLQEQQQKYNSPKLQTLYQQNNDDLKDVKQNWSKARKQMKERSYKNSSNDMAF